jgi:hypothetical protein
VALPGESEKLQGTGALTVSVTGTICGELAAEAELTVTTPL